MCANLHFCWGDFFVGGLRGSLGGDFNNFKDWGRGGSVAGMVLTVFKICGVLAYDLIFSGGFVISFCKK